MLTQILYNHQYDREGNEAFPAKRVAADLGKPLGTYQREINPNDDGAKFGVDQLIPWMKSTGKAREVLDFIAAHFDLKVSPMCAGKPDKATLCAELLDDYPAMVTYHESMKGGEDLERVGRKRQALEDEIAQSFVAYRNQLAGK